MTGFTKPAHGGLFLDDVDITHWSPGKRARAGLGRSFQSLELFEDTTVLENLRVGSDQPSVGSYVRDLVWPTNPPLTNEVVLAIREFKLQGALRRKAEDLSYGERRLLPIARAVAAGPNVLLLDEPAAGLGEIETAELARLVRRLADQFGMAILLVEHDMNFVMSVCDELVVLDFGRCIAAGAPDVVRSDPAVIAAYLGEDEDEVEEELAATGHAIAPAEGHST